MSIPTLAQNLFCPTQCTLAADAARLGTIVFGFAIVALESWLRMPIRPLFDGYAQSFASQLSSLIAAVFQQRPF